MYAICKTTLSLLISLSFQVLSQLTIQKCSYLETMNWLSGQFRTVNFVTLWLLRRRLPSCEAKVIYLSYIFAIRSSPLPFLKLILVVEA